MPEAAEDAPSLRAGFWALMVLGIALRAWDLGRSIGGGDEAQTYVDYAGTAFSHIATTFFFGGHHVLQTLLSEAGLRLLGDESAVGYRLALFIGGAATLWLVHLLALELFASRRIALCALMIAAVNPIHVYYSQTARGYSLIVFFAVLQALAAVRLLDAPRHPGWIAGFIAAAAGGVYAISTNVYFEIGLAGWLLAVLFFPAWARKIPVEKRRAAIRTFTLAFIVAGLIAAALYLPLIKQIVAEAKVYHLAHEHETSRLIIAARVAPNALELIFPGPLPWFLPLLIAGCLRSSRPGAGALPFFILLLPLVVPLATGVSGYPRNYLYNFPVLAVFLGAGIVRAGEWAGAFRRAGVLLALVYGVLSVQQITAKTIPAMRIPDGAEYQKRVRAILRPADLLLFADTRDFMYGMTPFREGVREILRADRVDGLRAVVREPQSLLRMVLPGDTSPLFRRARLVLETLPAADVGAGRWMLDLAGKNSVSLLPPDYEAVAGWFPVLGEGRVEVDATRKFEGLASVRLQAGGEKPLQVRSGSSVLLEEAHPVWLVLLWSARGVDGGEDKINIYTPALMVHEEGPQGEESLRQLSLGKVNDGLKNTVAGRYPDSWELEVFLGYLEAGRHRLSVALQADPGPPVAFDALRLFALDARR